MLKAGLLTFEGTVEASVAFPVGFDDDGENTWMFIGDYQHTLVKAETG